MVRLAINRVFDEVSHVQVQREFRTFACSARATQWRAMPYVVGQRSPLKGKVANGATDGATVDCQRQQTRMNAGPAPDWEVMSDGLPPLAHVRSGKLRALAVTSLRRHPAATEIPTVAESGVPGLATFSSSAWFGLLAPAGTPSALLDRINADVRSVLRGDAAWAVVDALGFAPADEDAASFGSFIARESERWTELVRKRGITAD